MNRILVLSLIILAFSNLSFMWPVDDGKITSNFGESRGDHFHDGIDMVSASNNICSVANGKLVFAWNRALFPLQNYWGGGNYKIIRNDNGLLSVYMHLEDGESLKPSYASGEVIAYMGNTGHSYGKHIHFSILDNIKRESINPLVFLPPYEDKQPPQILNFYIKIDDRYIRINEKSQVRLTKHYPLLVEIRDTITGRENLGIDHIKAMFNGKEVLNVEFNRIGISEKGLTVNNNIFQDLIDEKGYYKISGLAYTEGINTVTVIASDYNGNATEKVFNIDVHLDMQGTKR